MPKQPAFCGDLQATPHSEAVPARARCLPKATPHPVSGSAALTAFAASKRCRTGSWRADWDPVSLFLLFFLRRSFLSRLQRTPCL